MPTRLQVRTMRKTIQFVVFLKNFATGVMVPVLSLALMAHGASINTLSLMIGAYSLTVILAEFPSGVFADLRGRKTAFLVSALLFVLSYCLILSSQSAGLLICSMVANGLGRAFSSGSIDALAIDEADEHNSTLEWITARLAILESAGCATGALAGGLIAGIGSRYMYNLGVNAVIYAALFLIALLFIRESPLARHDGSAVTGQKRLGAQVKGSLAFMLQKGTVRALFALSLVTGFALIAVETYWQPALSAYHPASWILGAVSFAGYAVVIAGSWWMERLLARHPALGTALLLGTKGLMGLALVCLFLQTKAASFLAAYLMIYLFVGGGSVAENTLLNRFAPSSHRAGILSLFSFVLQVGGVIAAGCGYLVSTYGSFQTMWLIGGVATLLCAAIFAGVSARNRRAPNPD